MRADVCSVLGLGSPRTGVSVLENNQSEFSDISTAQCVLLTAEPSFLTLTIISA